MNPYQSETAMDIHMLYVKKIKHETTFVKSGAISNYSSQISEESKFQKFLFAHELVSLPSIASFPSPSFHQYLICLESSDDHFVTLDFIHIPIA